MLIRRLASRGRFDGRSLAGQLVCGGLWWFVVVCGGLWWFVVDAGGGWRVVEVGGGWWWRVAGSGHLDPHQILLLASCDSSWIQMPLDGSRWISLDIGGSWRILADPLSRLFGRRMRQVGVARSLGGSEWRAAGISDAADLNAISLEEMHGGCIILGSDGIWGPLDSAGINAAQRSEAVVTSSCNPSLGSPPLPRVQEVVGTLYPAHQAQIQWCIQPLILTSSWFQLHTFLPQASRVFERARVHGESAGTIAQDLVGAAAHAGGTDNACSIILLL